MGWSGMSGEKSFHDSASRFHQRTAAFVEYVRTDGYFAPTFSNSLQIDGELAAVGIERLLLLAAFVEQQVPLRPGKRLLRLAGLSGFRQGQQSQNFVEVVAA